MSDKLPQPGQGLDWAFGRWRKIFVQLDKEAIARRVRELTEAHPKDSKRRLVRRVIKTAARNSALAGVASASPALLPGIGTAVSVIGIVPEEIYLVRRKCEMLLQIAAVYGFDPAEDERLYELVALAGTPSRSLDALMTAKDDLKRLAARAAASIGPETPRLSVFGAKTFGRRVLRRLPALGFFLGGGINFVGVRALGRKACRFYSRQRVVDGDGSA